MREKVRVFKALSDSNRIRILKMLEVRPLCVCEITEVLKLAPSTVSKHLSILRDAGFIVDEKEGKWVNYYLNPDLNNKYVKQLIPLVKTWFHDDDKIKLDLEKVKTVDRNILCGK
jgi:ArsR family transcriptional regulator